MKKRLMCLCTIIMLLPVVPLGHAQELHKKDEINCIKNENGVEITENEYNKLRKNYSEKQILKMDYSDVKNLQDGMSQLIDEKTVYIETKYFEDKFGNLQTREVILDPDQVEQEQLKIKKQTVFEKQNRLSLISQQDIHTSNHETALKKMTMKTYKSSAATGYTVTLQNEWKTMPSVRSLDVMAIRFGNVDGLVVYKAEETYAQQIWNNSNIIKYSSTSDKFYYKTSGCSNGKAGVGVTMNLKDSASALNCYLQVRYTASAKYVYSIYGTYQHATSNVSDTSYTFSPTGMGNVIEFKKNANVYDNTAGLDVVADR